MKTIKEHSIEDNIFQELLESLNYPKTINKETSDAKIVEEEIMVWDDKKNEEVPKKIKRKVKGNITYVQVPNPQSPEDFIHNYLTNHMLDRVKTHVNRKNLAKVQAETQNLLKGDVIK